MSVTVPRFTSGVQTNASQHVPVCHPAETTEAILLFSIAALGSFANIMLMVFVIVKKPQKRTRQTWSHGLLIHQSAIDLARALLLIPLGVSVLWCQRLSRCSIIDTAFLILVTVSTVNMLTTLINDAPIFPEHEQLGSISAAVSNSRLRRDQTWLEMTDNFIDNYGNAEGESPYCIVFGIFIIWFASLTINLGPTFLSGGLTGSPGVTGNIDVCPMVYRPVRHYVLNVLWIAINLLCVGLMAIHLRKLYRDIIKSNLEAVKMASFVTTMIPVQSERDEREQKQLRNYIQRLEEEGLNRVKMFIIILIAYIIFWGPLYTITLAKPGLETSLLYEITLHIAFVHSFVNPTLLIVMHRDLSCSENRKSCCHRWFTHSSSSDNYESTSDSHRHSSHHRQSDMGDHTFGLECHQGPSSVSRVSGNYFRTGYPHNLHNQTSMSFGESIEYDTTPVGLYPDDSSSPIFPLQNTTQV